jgi:hypothetical protein
MEVHNHSFVGHIGPVIVAASMVLDHKSLQAAVRMLARTAEAVTRGDHSPTKTKGDSSLPAVVGILPRP